MRSGARRLLGPVCGLAGLLVLAGAALAETPAPPDASAPQPQPQPPPRAAADPARRALPGNLVGHGGPVRAIAVRPDGRAVLTGSFDYAMTAWDLADGGEARAARRMAEHDGAVNAVAFVPGGTRALAATDDGALVVWDLTSGVAVHRFKAHEGKILGLAVSPDGRRAATASWDRTGRLFDLERLVPIAVLEGHKGPVNAVAFAPDGRTVLTAGYDGRILLHDAEGVLVRPVLKHGWGVNAILPLADGRLLFGALNGTAAIVDPATGATLHELQSHARPVLALAAIDKPGLVATAGADGTVRVYRQGDLAPVASYQAPAGPVWAMAFAGDGTALYLGGLDDFVTRWQFTPQSYAADQGEGPRRFQLSGRAGDPVALGELQFARKCSICHTLEPDGRNRAGPTLFGIFGRKPGSVVGYPYSPALTSLPFVWTEETVAKLFELGPDELTPGSKMPLQRMTDRGERDALIAYLRVAGGAGKPVDGRPAGGQGSSTQGDTR